MASWTDNLSDAEVDALYKYKQKGVDGLSDTEVDLVHPHLDKLKIKEETPGIGAMLNAGAETIANTAAGFVGMGTGALAGITNALNTGVREGRLITPKELEHAYEQGAEIPTKYLNENTSPLGKEWTNKVGEALMQTVPVMPLHGMFPHMKPGEAVNAMKAKFGKEVAVPSTAPSLDTILKQKEEQLTKPTNEDLGAWEKKQFKLSNEQTVRENELLKKEEQSQLALPMDEQDGVYKAPQYSATEDFHPVIDENGMPIRAGKSIEAQAMENPLQRNLWGDELVKEHPQEGPSMLDALNERVQEARDTREVPFQTENEQQLKALENTTPASPELSKAVETANNAFAKAAEEKALKAEQEVYDVQDKVASGKATPVALKQAQHRAQKARLLASSPAKRRGQIGAIFLGKEKPSTELAKNFMGVLGKERKTITNNPIYGNDMLAKLREVGNSGIKSLEEAIALSKGREDAHQNILQKLSNHLSSGGAYLKTRVQDPFVHYFVDKMLEAKGKAAGEITKRVHSEYTPLMRKLSDKEFIEAQKIADWHDKHEQHLTKEAIEAYPVSKGVKDLLSKHAEVKVGDLKGMNAAREALGLKPIEARAGYSSNSIRSGWRQVGYLTEKNADGSIKLDKNGEPVRNVVAVVNSPRHGQLAKHRAFMEKHTPGIEWGPEPIEIGTTKQKGDVGKAMSDTLKLLSKDSPEFRQFLDSLEGIADEQINAYRGMDKRALAKKGVIGTEGRKPWLSEMENAKEFWEEQKNQSEKAIIWEHYAPVMQELSKALSDPELAGNKNALKIASNYVEQSLGFNPYSLGRFIDQQVLNSKVVSNVAPKKMLEWMRTAANTKMMSGNINFLLNQFMGPMTTLPGLSQFLKGRGVEHSLIVSAAKGSMDLASHLSGSGKVSEVGAQALKWAKENHTWGTDMMQRSEHVREDVSHYGSKIASGPTVAVEAGTRATAFMSLVHALHEGGLKPKDGLFEQADRFTNMAMGDYSAMERPPIFNVLGSLGGPVFNLMKYKTNEASRLALFTRELYNNKSGRALAMQLASYQAMAGALGLPAMGAIAAAYGVYTSMTGEEKSLKLEIVKKSEKLPEALGLPANDDIKYLGSHGLPAALFGKDTSSLGVGDLFSTSLLAGGNVLKDMAVSPMEAAIHPTKSEYSKKAIYDVMPSIIAGPLKNAWFTDKGGLRHSPDPTKAGEPGVRTTPLDRAYSAVGMRGVHEATEGLKDFETRKLDIARKGKVKEAINGMLNDLRERNTLGEDNINKFLKNSPNPDQFQQQLEKALDDKQLSTKEKMMKLNNYKLLMDRL
jgi:hypothetical protein